MTPKVFMFTGKIRTFFGRHHPIVFIAVTGLLLAVALLALYGVLTSTDASTTTSSSIGGFDEKTADKIKALRASDSGNATITLPSPRPNPFVE